MAATHAITTAEQLLEAPGLGRCELLGGELVMMSPAGFEHGRIVNRLSVRLGTFVESQALGVVTGAETGFHIAENPDTVRAPDVAWVHTRRVPSTPTRGFFRGAPDLAAEVLSPDDRASEVQAKVQQWLDAGCQSVWVVDPLTRSVTTYHRGGTIAILRSTDTLTEEALLPGFSVSVAEVFAP
jgi:Uma2 family endonuclease